MGLGGLLRYLLIALAVWILYRTLRRWVSGASGGGRPRRGTGPSGESEVLDVMVQDPQCGTYLPRHEAIRAWARGEERFFCSEACRDNFLAGVDKKS